MAGSRLFDGIDDAITFAAGRAVPTTAFTLAIVVKPTLDAEQFLIGDGNLTLGIVTPSRVLALYNGSSVPGTSVTAPVLNAWQCIFASHEAGATGVVRFSRYTYNDARIVHENAGTQPDNTTTSHVIGSAFGGYYLGSLVAAAAVFPTVLADGARLTTAVTFAGWAARGPSALWRLDGDPLVPVIDLSGNGADQTAITGTAHSADEPPGFWPAATRPRRSLLLGVG